MGSYHAHLAKSLMVAARSPSRYLAELDWGCIDSFFTAIEFGIWLRKQQRIQMVELLETECGDRSRLIAIADIRVSLFGRTLPTELTDRNLKELFFIACTKYAQYLQLNYEGDGPVQDAPGVKEFFAQPRNWRFIDSERKAETFVVGFENAYADLDPMVDQTFIGRLRRGHHFAGDSDIGNRHRAYVDFLRAVGEGARIRSIHPT